MSRVIKFATVGNAPVTLKPSLYMVNTLVAAADQQQEILDPEEILSQAKLEADQIVKIAKLQAEQVLNDARTEAEQMQQQAYHDGFQQGQVAGYENGMQQVHQQMADAIANSQSIVVDAIAQRNAVLTEMEPQILQLSVQIASKILCQQLNENSFLVLNVVQGALKKAKEHDQITIKVNPTDYRLVQECGSELRNLVGSDKVLTIMAELSVGAGGCVIDTAFGAVDARIDTQLETIKNALLDVVK